MCVLGGRGGTLSVTCGTLPSWATTTTFYTTTTSSTLRKFFKNTYLMFYKLAKGTALAELKQHFLVSFLNEDGKNNKWIYLSVNKECVSPQSVYFSKRYFNHL